MQNICRWFAPFSVLMVMGGVLGAPIVQAGDARERLAAAPTSRDVTMRAPSPGTPAALAPISQISVEHGRLSVHVQDQELRTVLQEIAAQGHIEVHHLKGLPSRCISVRFTALPMVDGLKHLLHAADVPDYVLVTSKQGDGMKVERLILLAVEKSLDGAMQGVHSAQRPSPASPARPAQADRGNDEREGREHGEEETQPEEEAVAEEQQERLEALRTSAAQSNTEALQQALFDPDQTINR